MATTVAGSKRSYHDMEEASSTARRPLRAQPSYQVSQSPPVSHGNGPSVNQDAMKSNKLSEATKRGPYESNASIVLVGVRGVGKSTLGILAATAYSRRLVDSERVFLETTGETASAYRKSKGTAEYRARHNEVLEATLNNNSSGAVIVCSFSDLEGKGGDILRRYSESHPVVHITRDVEGIKTVLQVWTSERINELLTTSASLLRSCSNYEFFNLTQAEQLESNGQSGNGSASEDFLTLKRVERDFMRLLRNAVGDHERGQAHHSAYPFSNIDVEKRSYTFAVSISTSQILQGNLDLDAAQVGADCVELLVDLDFESRRQYFQDICKAFAIIRRNTILPIMISLESRHHSERLTSQFDTFDYLLRLGADYICVDMSLNDLQIGRLEKSKGRSKIVGFANIGVRPEQGWNDPSIISTYTRAAQIGCDLVKITMPTSAVEDVSALLSLRDRVAALGLEVPLIAYNSGSRGRTSRCFNRMLTSVRSYRSSSDNNAEDTSDVSAADITKALFAAFVYEPMKFSIFGGDVSYSLSPAMHNAAYTACGMNYKYEAISSESMEKLYQVVKARDFGGTAVVQPYKTSALGLVDALSTHAEAIRAVNTIIPIREMNADGKIPSEAEILSRRSQQGPVLALYGFNTDWIGIRACIRKALSPANTIRNQSTALVCGAGGMASSAIYSLISLGLRNIFVCNRTLTRAQTLAQHYNGLIRAKRLSELRAENAAETKVRVLGSLTDGWPTDARPPAIVVNCIPRLTAENTPIDFRLQESWLKSPTGGVVVEVAYRQPTSFVEEQVRARAEAGWIFMDGYDVLPEQAFSQFELFTGRRAPRKLMRDEIKKYLQSHGKQLI